MYVRADFDVNPSQAMQGCPCSGWEGFVAFLPSGDAFWDPVGLGAVPGSLADPVQAMGTAEPCGTGGGRCGERCCLAAGGWKDREVADRRCPAAVWGLISPEQLAVLTGARAQG